ncbi:hypothetical protein [Halogranum rubrum]|nr:hypothetical protein [Halogranum rubrum]
MREDTHVRPVQSTRKASRSRLPSSRITRALLGGAMAVALVSVVVTGELTWVYPTFGFVCVAWGLKEALMASTTPRTRIETDPSDLDQ